MTPLAQHLLKDWCQPKAKRALSDPAGLMPLLLEAKCFNCSALVKFPPGVEGANISDLVQSGRVFLPAPVSFFEAASGNGTLAVQGRDDDTIVTYSADPLDGIRPFVEINLRSGVYIPLRPLYCRERVAIDSLFPLLFLINTPRLVGQKVHNPHAGLQRKLAKSLGLVGEFPLHAWTEIKLWCDADDISEIDSDHEIEARFSRQKCLHFVRSFLRWRNGQLERVKAHWRGNPAIGMKRSRYDCRPRPSAPSSAA